MLLPVLTVLYAFLSMLSEGVRGRVRALTELLRGLEAVDLPVPDSRESFRSNRHYYQARPEREELPALRELLRQDMGHLNEIQSAAASARKFAFACRRDEKSGGDSSSLKQLEKRIRDCGFHVRLAEKEDIMRLLEAYYQQDMVTEHFDRYDGEGNANG